LSADELLLAIDVGNTSIAIGLFDGEEMIATFRIATDQDNLPDEYAMLLLGLLRSQDIDPSTIHASIMSSTVPPLLNTFRAVCRQHFDVDAIVVGPGVKTGIRVLYDNPREVGPDRILHAVAALDRYDPPLVIVDLGTALVFDAVSKDGDYLGGTVNSMQAGIIFGYAEMVRGMVERFKAEIGDDATVIATGGYARAIADEAACFDAIEDDLNLLGLRLVYEANQ
jgi:type III pantothenate kinase